MKSCWCFLQHCIDMRFAVNDRTIKHDQVVVRHLKKDDILHPQQHAFDTKSIETLLKTVVFTNCISIFYSSFGRRKIHSGLNRFPRRYVQS